MFPRILRIAAVSSFLAVTCLSSLELLAFPVIFGFQGRINHVFDGLGALPPSVAPGIPFFGAYVFESTTPNSGPPPGEGEVGLYHHERPPAGVVVRLGRVAFASNPRHPDFSIVVTDNFGFAGSDGYGFESLRNRAFGTRRQLTSADRLDIRWNASTFDNSLFSDVDLPLVPPDLNLLGGGDFQIEGVCGPCAAPAAFYRIEGTMTSLFPLSRIPSQLMGVGGFPFAAGVDVLGLEDSPSVVPEPHGMLLTFLLAVSFVNRRPRKVKA